MTPYGLSWMMQRMEWKPIDTVPRDRDVEIAVTIEDAIYLLRSCVETPMSRSGQNRKWRLRPARASPQQIACGLSKSRVYPSAEYRRCEPFKMRNTANKTASARDGNQCAVATPRRTVSSVPKIKARVAGISM